MTQGARLIEKHLDASHVLVNVGELDRISLLTKMVRRLVVGGRIRYPLAVLHGLHAREEVEPTTILPGFAIPHFRTRLAEGFNLALATSREGCPFGAPGGEKTRVILAAVFHPNFQREYLDLLSRLGWIFSDREWLDRLSGSDDAIEARQILVERERSEFGEQVAGRP
ncbi:MAG: PTS sugar transporter subunit IIA [Planctomycetes bacterium]|nr:PTS sugar transporter subunit IIA [Planctomycetota bacterium]